MNGAKAARALDETGVTARRTISAGAAETIPIKKESDVNKERAIMMPGRQLAAVVG